MRGTKTVREKYAFIQACGLEFKSTSICRVLKTRRNSRARTEVLALITKGKDKWKAKPREFGD